MSHSNCRFALGQLHEMMLQWDLEAVRSVGQRQPYKQGMQAFKHDVVRNR